MARTPLAQVLAAAGLTHASVAGGRVAVVGRGRRDEVGERLRGLFRDAHVRDYDAGLPDEALHVLLAADGPFDLVVDVAGKPGAVGRLPRVLYHLNPGGVLVFRRPGSAGFDALLSAMEQVRLQGARAPVEPRDRRPWRERDLHALAASTGLRLLTEDWVVLDLGVAVLAKLAEAATSDFLVAGQVPERMLHRLPAVRWRADGEVRGSDPARAAAVPRDHEGRELWVREWPDAVSLPHGGVLWDNVVVPDTYRRRLDDRLRSEAVLDWSHWFVRDPLVEPEPLAGTYLHGDDEWRGHFGHALTEQVSRLWAWPWIKERFPEARWLVHARPGAPIAAWEHDLWAAGGVDPADVTVCHGPVRVERLLTATPAFSTPTTLHPVLRDVYDGIGARLERLASKRSWPDRVFLGRRATHQRTCHNADDVERLLRRHGFEVVYPEDHSLADQATFVRRATTIAGFTGSGMYQVALAGGPRHVIGIGSDSYTGWVEARLAALLGHRLDLVWCASDVGRSTTWTQAGFKADFTFDPNSEGAWLEQVLSSLSSTG